MSGRVGALKNEFILEEIINWFLLLDMKIKQ